MNIKPSIICFLLSMTFCIILSANIVLSFNDNVALPKTCSDTWGVSCGSVSNDAFQTCIGNRSGDGFVQVNEVYINASAFTPGAPINVTCEFHQDQDSLNSSQYIWYYNSSSWMMIWNGSQNATSSSLTENRSVAFNLNTSLGPHIVRCIIEYNSTSDNKTGNNGCAIYTTTNNNWYDNDDINFTVTDLRYTSWNITNSTTSEAGSGGTYNNTQNLTISARWNKNISYALIEHNGTGTWVNYTIPSPYAGNWTNYTLNLSDAIQFNHTTIAIRSIYVNDTFGLENYTSPLLYFYLSAGNPPNVTYHYFESTSGPIPNANLYSNVWVRASVSDDVGLSTVIANITYPNGNSINVSMTRDSYQIGYELWKFTFNDIIPINETGNYIVRVIARDIGGQEKVSGADQGTSETATLTVEDTYLLEALSDTNYNRGENLTVNVFDVLPQPVTTLNWTINLTKFNQQPVTLNGKNIVTFQINNSDPAGNYSMFVNVSGLGNSGNNTYEFNVSNELNLTISTSVSSPTLRGVPITVNVSVYNVRSTLYNSTFSANISCHNSSNLYAMSPLTFSSSNASFTCTSPSDYDTNYNITVNVTDTYNNTGISIVNLTTESAPSGGSISPGGGGSGGGGVVKNITIYQNITSNATTGFNFTLQTSEIQIYRGEDATIVGALSNTGNTNLSVSSSVYLNSTCCVVSINPSEFMLEVGGSEVPFTISVHVNTTTEPYTEHFADIILKTGSLEKSKRIKIIVKENPTISNINQVTGQISEVEEKIREYAKLGINTKFLEDLLNKIKGTKADSNTAMEKDDINRLKQSNDFIQSSLKQINDGLNKLAFLKMIYKNKWNIFSGITIGIVSTYLVVQVLVPYSRAELEIRKLILERDSLVKSRIETEKSYFLRKIDEKTFRSILTDRQGKIYKLKSMIDLKNEAKNNLIRTRLNPAYFGKWIKEKITKIRPKQKQVSLPKTY